MDVVWKTLLRLVLPKYDDFRLDLHVERREMIKSNRSVAKRVFNVEVEADRHQRHHVWEILVATVHHFGRRDTSRGASARCVFRGVVSETE
eukprot:6199472-Pleurochrysis_carterae.AAC.1